MSEPQKPLFVPAEETKAIEASELIPASGEPVSTEVTEEKPRAQDARQGGETRVLVHNDDETPYEFVIDILNSIFMLSEEMAEHVAWTAHTRGTAVVVVRPRPEAEKLVKAAHTRAKLNRHPLTFSLEAD